MQHNVPSSMHHQSSNNHSINRLSHEIPLVGTMQTVPTVHSPFDIYHQSIYNRGDMNSTTNIDINDHEMDQDITNILVCSPDTIINVSYTLFYFLYFI